MDILSQFPKVLEIYLSDGSKRDDFLAPGTFFMEAYTDNDTIWVGVAEDNRDSDNYVLESAHDGFLFEDIDLNKVLDEFMTLYSVSFEDMNKIWDFAENYT